MTAADQGEVAALHQVRPAILVDYGDGPAHKPDPGTVYFEVHFTVARSVSYTAGFAWK